MNTQSRDEKKNLHEEFSKYTRLAQRGSLNGGFSLKMVPRRSSHGGEEDCSIHLAFNKRLGEIERRRSKKKWKNSRAGLGSLFLKKLQEEEEGKELLLK